MSQAEDEVPQIRSFAQHLGLYLSGFFDKPALTRDLYLENLLISLLFAEHLGKEQ